MDSNFQKCTFLASSTEICACSLVLVDHLVIAVPLIIVDRGDRLVSYLSLEVLPEMPAGALQRLIRLKSRVYSAHFSRTAIE